MKKSIFFLLIVLPFIFSSCSHDDDDTPPSLKYTVWEGIQDDIKNTLTFSELESTMVLTSLEFPSITSYVTYTYTYTHPKVIMYPKNLNKAIIEGTVSNDYKTMVLVNTSSSKIIARVTRK